MDKNFVSQLEVNVQQVTDVALTRNMSCTDWAATFHTLHFGGHAWSSKTQHVWCYAGLRGCKVRDGKAQSCSKQPPRSSHPPGTTAHIHLLMEPCTRCCLSNLNSGFIVYNCSWWFLVLPYSDSAMAQPWLSTSLKGGLKTSWCFWPPRSIISKDYATSMVLAVQPCCLLCPCQEHRAISQSFQVTLLWELGTRASSAQQPLRSWDQSPADALKRSGLELRTMESVLYPALERPAQMKMGQWLMEEKARTWFPCGRRESTTANSSINKWYYLEVQGLNSSI